MQPDLFTFLDSVNPTEGFACLTEQFQSNKEYSLLFEARLMQKRHELGLPPIQTAEVTNPEYQETVMEAAREAGTLFLADHRISRAWPYFRAIAEPAPVAAAIEAVEPTAEDLDQVISIAFQEGVHPRKGLELMMEKHGMCRAITAFGMQAVTKDRAQCIALLANNIHGEIAARLSRTIEEREPSFTRTNSLPELIQDREWLFGEWDTYVDTSHLLSVIPYCMEITDPAVLRTFAELCAYGNALAPQFHQPGNPPFEDQFTAYAHYIQTLLGEDVETHLDYFRAKIADTDPDLAGDAPARVLVKLLVALGRPKDALTVLLESVDELAPYGMPVPSALQLCMECGDFETLKSLARERGDLLSYAAGCILAKSE